MPLSNDLGRFFSGDDLRRARDDCATVDNAYVTWLRSIEASDCVGSRELSEAYDMGFADDMTLKPLDVASKRSCEAIVGRNSSALALLASGLEKPYLRTRDVSDSITRGAPTKTSRVRFADALLELAKVKYLRGRCYIAAGADPAAARDAIELCAMATKATSGDGGGDLYSTSVFLRKYGYALISEILWRNTSVSSEVLTILDVGLAKTGPYLGHFLTSFLLRVWETILAMLYRISALSSVAEMVRAILDDRNLTQLVQSSHTDSSDEDHCMGTTDPRQAPEDEGSLLEEDITCIARSVRGEFSKERAVARMADEFATLKAGLDATAVALRKGPLLRCESRERTAWPVDGSKRPPHADGRKQILHLSASEHLDGNETRLEDCLVAAAARLVARNLRQHAFWWFDARLSHNVAHLFVAIAEFRRRTGDFPIAVDDLTTAGILDRIPVDPYTGESFRYDRNYRQLTCTLAESEATEWAEVFRYLPPGQRRQCRWSLKVY